METKDPRQALPALFGLFQAAHEMPNEYFDLLDALELMALGGDHGRGDTVFGVHPSDDQAEVIADHFAVDGEGAREFLGIVSEVIATAC